MRAIITTVLVTTLISCSAVLSEEGKPAKEWVDTLTKEAGVHTM